MTYDNIITMERPRNVSFPYIKIQPLKRQFVVDEWPLMFLLIVLLIGGGLDSFAFKMLCLVGAAVDGMYLAYRLAYLRNMVYIVSPEQIIYQHGVLGMSVDYMELYRVVDYQQNVSFLQQLLRIKTVVIMSGDKSMPVLKMVGIDYNLNVVNEIRNRVEFNKKRRGVYEITNRF